MIWFCLIIPISVLLLQYFVFRHNNHPIEYVGQIGIPVLLVILLKLIGGNIGTIDTEYWGGYLTRAVHEEDWNEYIHQICFREVPCGTDSEGRTTYCTESYDCSYVEYHPEIWWVENNNGGTWYVSQNFYISLTAKWGNQKKTGHHSGYTDDGDIFSTFFNNDDTVLQKTTSVNSYKNKVAASNSVFNFPEILPEEAAKLGLFNYPDENIFGTQSILGYTNSSQFDLLNAKLGRSKQIRVWVLVYTDKPMSIFEEQKNYWKNGNKNELIFGVGISNGVVKWVNVMTWCEQDEFNIRARNELAKQINGKPDFDKFAVWLYPEIQKYWIRKQFSDFDYIKVEPPLWFVVLAFFLTLASSLGIGYLFLSNNLTMDDFDIREYKSFFIRRRRW